MAIVLIRDKDADKTSYNYVRDTDIKDNKIENNAEIWNRWGGYCNFNNKTMEVVEFTDFKEIEDAPETTTTPYDFSFMFNEIDDIGSHYYDNSFILEDCSWMQLDKLLKDLDNDYIPIGVNTKDCYRKYSRDCRPVILEHKTNGDRLFVHVEYEDWLKMAKFQKAGLIKVVAK